MTCGEAAPAATATLHACEACSISVLFGGGALFEFCAKASQQRLRLGPATPPVFFGSSAEADGTGSGASSSVGGAAVVEAVAGADGRGGGGSSFLQPEARTESKNPEPMIATTERSGFMVMFLA